MVGVTKAQQSLQNRFGWKPIIISMSSQNLCRPALAEQKQEQQERRGREWPRFNEVRTSKFNPFLCAWQQRKITLGHAWEERREQMVSFLCSYWWITVSDSHTIISICHLFHCCDKLMHSRFLLDSNLLAHTWAPAWGGFCVPTETPSGHSWYDTLAVRLSGFRRASKLTSWCSEQPINQALRAGIIGSKRHLVARICTTMVAKSSIYLWCK